MPLVVLGITAFLYGLAWISSFFAFLFLVWLIPAIAYLWKFLRYLVIPIVLLPALWGLGLVGIILSVIFGLLALVGIVLGWSEELERPFETNHGRWYGISRHRLIEKIVKGKTQPMKTTDSGRDRDIDAKPEP
ncbi:MAG: hypothetical protein ACR2L2_12910 [Acidobacteriota bacterium]